MVISGLVLPELFLAACYLQGAVQGLRAAEKVRKET